MKCSHTGLPIYCCAHCQGNRFPDERDTVKHGFRADKPIFTTLGGSTSRMREAAQGTRNARWRFNTTRFDSHAQIRILAGMIAGKLEKTDEQPIPVSAVKALPK